jgi:hypothetical protein
MLARPRFKPASLRGVVTRPDLSGILYKRFRKSELENNKRVIQPTDSPAIHSSLIMRSTHNADYYIVLLEDDAFPGETWH